MIINKKLTFRAAAEITGLIIGAFSMIYISRIVGPEYIGFSAATSSIILLISRLGDGGLTALATQRLARDDEKLGYLLSVTIPAKVVVSSSLVVFSLLIINMLNLDNRLVYFLNISLFVIFFDVCTPQWVFIALGRINIASVIRIAQSIFYASTILVFIHKPDDWKFLPFLLLINSAFNFIFSTFFLFYLKIFEIDRFVFTKGYINILKNFYREAFHFLKGELSIYVFTSSDRLILYFFTSPSVVGIYEAAYKIITPFYSIAGVVTSTMFRDLAQSFKNNKLYPLFSKYVFLMSVFTIPLGFFLLFFSKEVIEILYGPRFAASADCLRILGFVITFGFTSGIMVGPFSAWNMSREFGSSIFWGNIINIALNFVLIPFLGAIGAALATLAAKIIVTVIGYIYFRRATDYPILKDFLFFFAASILPLLLVANVAIIVPETYFLFAVYAVTYLILAAFLYKYFFKSAHAHINP